MRLTSSPSCVITGAGAGLGRAITLALARRQGRLVVSDIALEAAEQTASLAAEAGARKVGAVRCDVTELSEVEALAASCSGPIDLVVNNAGVAAAGLVGELSIEDWRWTLGVDLWGVIHGCHVFTPLLRRQGHGHILNVASVAAFGAAPRMGPYNVAKAGVVSLSETLAAELVGTGVGVTVLCPSFFKSAVVSSGHFADAKTRSLAERLMSRAIDVDTVAHAALASVENDELYCLPMADGRWLWRLKRLSPRLYTHILGAVVKKWEST
jgi:NAD(P)-dependent dehydrogenase (short-subunit alcohol dehydrogenase family)